MGWDQEDQDKVLAYLSYQGEMCPNCNTVIDDWFDEDGVPLSEPPYELQSKRCIGCKTMAEEQELAAKSKERGIFFFFKRVIGYGRR